MTTSRRQFLKIGGGTTALALLLGPNLWSDVWAAAPSPLAAGDDRKQFETQDFNELIKDLGGKSAQESDQIELRAPEIAENGAVVPVEIDSKLPGTKMIAIVSEKNPHALTAVFHIPEGTEPYVSTRVKIAETSKLIALVQTDQGFFHADRLVKVTLGGCGG